MFSFVIDFSVDRFGVVEIYFLDDRSLSHWFNWQWIFDDYSLTSNTSNVECLSKSDYSLSVEYFLSLGDINSSSKFLRSRSSRCFTTDLSMAYVHCGIYWSSLFVAISFDEYSTCICSIELTRTWTNIMGEKKKTEEIRWEIVTF